MKITKKQFDLLIEKTVVKVIHEQLQQNEASQLDNALATLMGKWDHEGVWQAVKHAPQVSELLKTLNPALASKVAPLWQQIVKQIKRASAAEKKRDELSSLGYGDDLDAKDDRLAKISQNAWMQADNLDRQIAKILKRRR